MRVYEIFTKKIIENYLQPTFKLDPISIVLVTPPLCDVSVLNLKQSPPKKLTSQLRKPLM